MSQTSVAEQAVANEGMKASSTGFDDVISRAGEGKVYFGRLVSLGTDKDKQAKHPAAAADITDLTKKLGVSIQSHALESKDDGESPHYADKDMVSIMRRGPVYVKPEQAIVPTDAVFVRFKGKKQVQTLVFDADLVTSNVVNGTVGGVAIAPVTFATSHLATMTALAAAIVAANPSKILSAVVGGSGNRTITVTSQIDQEADLAGFVVTLGASQAGAVSTETQAMVLESEKGKFRKDADNDETASATAAALAGATFKSSAAASSPVVLDVNF